MSAIPEDGIPNPSSAAVVREVVTNALLAIPIASRTVTRRVRVRIWVRVRVGI